MWEGRTSTVPCNVVAEDAMPPPVACTTSAMISYPHNQISIYSIPQHHTKKNVHKSKKSARLKPKPTQSAREEWGDKGEGKKGLTPHPTHPRIPLSKPRHDQAQNNKTSSEQRRRSDDRQRDPTFAQKIMATNKPHAKKKNREERRTAS